MRRAELHYDLPPALIAQQPLEPRDAARLLVLDRATGQIAHRRFGDLGHYVDPGDGLVLNNTRVLPARFFGRRATGARIEVLFLHESAAGWEVLLKHTRRLRPGERIACENDAAGLILVERGQRGAWLVRPDPPVRPEELLARVGHTPLPPYIRGGRDTPADAGRYQTVYAARPGAVAAPTAGLHFTPELLAQLAVRGVRRADVTLHVGAGTFLPIEVEDLAEHPMHAEWYEADARALDELRAVRAAGGSLVAVGTTSVRVLESLPAAALERGAGAVSGWTDIFIYPPYSFRHVDRLVTNFHLPGSTLLALVMAFAGVEATRAAYAEAVRAGYRFYSYGDAMLIL